MQRTTIFLALALSTFVFTSAACSSTATSRADNTATVQPAATTAALQAAIDAPGRDAANRTRDGYRHPLQTLEFFGVQPNQTVIEITPGGGWYSEILAPYLNADGHYIGAVPAAAADSKGGLRNAAFREKLTGNTASANATLVELDAKAPVLAAGTADVVLTFRNVHNWVAAGNTDAYFRAFFAALKPGGVLGVVDHRAKSGTDLEAMKSSGYLTEALVTKYATDAGFVLEASSDLNANPKDDADHPNGVWTLPPSNTHDAADNAKYKAIGESDRMTLRFRKPRGS
ncbi:methyltransferase [Thermomonas sp.]|uniref:class I SAM-dependent methyltransferase n=1 Tax=Thermomonas sp. TaxID=1971895 RepID=UPI002487187B|nr:methyltransferase [Thermomonas sp.]MDI1252289.1 methyltransferase [Thermomonas sp.]